MRIIKTGAHIAAWQAAVDLHPVSGARAELLEALSQAAFNAIKIIELERSGIRDGDGYWHGSDVIGHMTAELIELCHHLDSHYGPRLPDGEVPF